jgi:predicted heme/steroid binding protein
MYHDVDQFALDKTLNTIVEEGIAPLYIREYYRLQGKKVWKVEKNMGDLAQSKLYDLEDGMGVRWEIKHDRLWHVTGNVYVELQALEASQADKYIIFAGKAYVIAKSALWEAIRGMPSFAGGDLGKSLGVKLPLERLEEISEQAIIL